MIFDYSKPLLKASSSSIKTKQTSFLAFLQNAAEGWAIIPSDNMGSEVAEAGPASAQSTQNSSKCRLGMWSEWPDGRDKQSRWKLTTQAVPEKGKTELFGLHQSAPINQTTYLRHDILPGVPWHYQLSISTERAHVCPLGLTRCVYLTVMTSPQCWETSTSALSSLAVRRAWAKWKRLKQNVKKPPNSGNKTQIG